MAYRMRKFILKNMKHFYLFYIIAEILFVTYFFSHKSSTPMVTILLYSLTSLCLITICVTALIYVNDNKVNYYGILTASWIFFMTFGFYFPEIKPESSVMTLIIIIYFFYLKYKEEKDKPRVDPPSFFRKWAYYKQKMGSRDIMMQNIWNTVVALHNLTCEHFVYQGEVFEWGNSY